MKKFAKVGVPSLHIAHNAVNFLASSEYGIRSKISPNLFLSESPSNPYNNTCLLHLLTDFNTKTYKSLKNCASSIIICNDSLYFS